MRGEKRCCKVEDILLQRKTTVAANTFLVWDAVGYHTESGPSVASTHLLNTEILEVPVNRQYSKPA